MSILYNERVTHEHDFSRNWIGDCSPAGHSVSTHFGDSMISVAAICLFLFGGIFLVGELAFKLLGVK